MAHVGRSTFYSHYKSKDDLLERGLEQLRGMLVDMTEPKSGMDLCRVLFEHVAEYRDVQLALAGGRGEAIVDAALSGVLDQTLRRALSAPKTRGVPRDLVIQHTVATMHTVLRWWLKPGNDRIGAPEADALFRTLLLGGLPEEWQASFRERFVAAPEA